MGIESLQTNLRRQGQLKAALNVNNGHYRVSDQILAKGLQPSGR
jgi:hypothetical protein